MSFNPYASESANRISVKAAKSYEEQKAEREAAKGEIDHPLVEGKKLEMAPDEMKAFTKAMEQKGFRHMLNDYVDEISDPSYWPEQKKYMRQLEEQGDLPPGTELIQPEAGFCLKTTGKKLINEKKKSYFDQKTFINICFHEKVPKAERKLISQGGQEGYSWSLPYRVSKLRMDQDAKKDVCSTYDVVFHDAIKGHLVHNEFQKFVADTALDGIRRVLAETNEKVSTDYKIMKNMACKGGEPALMTVKKEESSNPLLANMDTSKHESKMQKDLQGQRNKHLQN